MRFSAIIPVVFCAAALILTFLAMFAGSSKGFMQDYALVTMNTSRIGYNIFENEQSTGSSNPLETIFNDITDGIENIIEGAVNSVAIELGLHDYYSVHLLTYCEGFYTPDPVPNASLPLSAISKNTTYCSRKTATFYFNPTEVIQNELNQAGHSNIQLQDLQWPAILNEGFRALRTAARVTFAFYCISIALIFVAFCLALIGIFLDGRISAFVNLSVDWTAFVAVLIASAIATYVSIQSTDLINENGEQIGVSATRGSKFLAITWAATGLMFVSSLVWCGDCIIGGRKHRRSKKTYVSESKRI